METFLDELATVRKELGLDEVHLWGWSWGGMLVLEYLLTRPQGVRSAVLASALHSVPAYLREAHRLAAELPPPVQATLRRFEEHYRRPTHKPAPAKTVSPVPTAKQTARKASYLRWAGCIVASPAAQHLADAASRIVPLRSSAYQVADVAFDTRYICRLNPLPDQQSPVLGVQADLHADQPGGHRVAGRAEPHARQPVHLAQYQLADGRAQ